MSYKKVLRTSSGVEIEGIDADLLLEWDKRFQEAHGISPSKIVGNYIQERFDTEEFWNKLLSYPPEERWKAIKDTQLDEYQNALTAYYLHLHRANLKNN